MASTGVTTPLIHGPRSTNEGYAYRQGLGITSAAEHFVFHDDFNSLITTNVPAGWTAAVIDTGATIVADTTAAHATGTLLFDSDGTTEGAAIYLPKTIQLTVGKKFFMEVRAKTEIADDSDLQFGLSDLTATTNPEDLWTTTAANLVSFGVLDGDATVGMLSDAGNSGTAVVLGTRDLTSATWHTLAIGYDGVNLRGYVDGQLAVTWTGAAATVPTGVALAPFVGFRNGSAATTEGHVDYVRIAIQR